jgi:polyisoprenyl-teichoic acid--peptidoglycan teichoic acid transferase
VAGGWGCFVTPPEDRPPDRDEGLDEETQEPGAETDERASRSGFTEEFEAALASDADDAPESDHAADDEPSLEYEEPAERDEPEEGDAEIDSVHQRISQETVEADVLALGDAEEAAEQAAAAGAGAPEVGEAPDAEVEEEAELEEEAEDEEEADEGEAELPVGVAVATEPAPSPTPPGPTVSPVEPAEEDDKPPKPRLWLRFLAASFVIVISMGTATAVTGLLYLTDIAKGLGGIEGVRQQLTQVEGGEPQTILILGSDQRPGDPTARSDTTMLLRLDPSQDGIALLSLPRDLKLNIPGYGVDRLNAAYSVGGPKLTLKTVQQLTGLQINHVVNVDFTGFIRAVNAIDCVYVDVDRRYYVPPEAGYAEINVEAGYQMLCGEKALQYVRFRHADTDITRTARQQDFLREARQKISPARLFRDRDQLIKIFTKYTTSDIEDPQTMLEVLKLFLSVADAPVKEIHFEGNLGPSYITFSQDQMKTAVQQFLGIEDTEGPRGGGAVGADESGGGGGGGGGGNKPESEPALIDSSEFGRHLAERFVRSAKFPVFYPTKLTPGAQFSADARTYEIADEDGHVHDIYKFVIQTPLLGEYYGLSGTTWEDPPILNNPSETREIGDRDFDLFYDGDRLRMVAWHTDEGSYWLTNSLLQSIDEQQMLEIAETTEDVEPK